MSDKVTADDIRKALREKYKEPDWYLGFEVGNATGTMVSRHADAIAINYNFISVEPIMAPFPYDELITHRHIGWTVIGAETGKRKDKVIPKKEWIDGLISVCDRENIPVFMKESMAPIVGEENMRRELPWEESEGKHVCKSTQ